MHLISGARRRAKRKTRCVRNSTTARFTPCSSDRQARTAFASLPSSTTARIAPDVWMGSHLDLVARLYDRGTAGFLRSLSKAGGLSTCNFRDGHFDANEKITGQTMSATILVKWETCFACAVRCKRVVRVKMQDQHCHKAAKKVRGVTNRTVSNFFMESKSSSPVTTYSAAPASAASISMSSLGSRQTLTLRTG